MSRRISPAMDRLYAFVMRAYTLHVRNSDMGWGTNIGAIKAIDDVNTVLAETDQVLKTARMQRIQAAKERTRIIIPRNKRRLTARKKNAIHCSK